MPQISIIIPTYNTAEFIAETLDSVFAQTFQDFEVIVINDGSPDTDELKRVIAPYRERILFLDQDNRGPAGARNTGIRHAQGKYVAFLDSDDCWLPDYLASQMKLFEENPSFAAVYSNAQHIGDPSSASKTYMQTCPSNGPVTIEALINEDCQVITSCTVAVKQAIVVAGLFDERRDLRGCEDYDLWLRILYHGGRMAYQRRVLGRYRSHPGSLSHNALKMSAARLAVYKKVEQTMQLPEKTRAILQQGMAKAQAHLDLETGRNLLASGDFDRAKDSLTKANHFFHATKLKLAILGLQFAPRVVRLAAAIWHKSVLRSRSAESSPNVPAD